MTIPGRPDAPAPAVGTIRLDPVDGIALADGTYGSELYGSRTYGMEGAEPLSARIFSVVPRPGWITHLP